MSGSAATVTIPFTPNALAPFQFQATLDGAQYNVVITWALFGARWFLNVQQQNGVTVLSTPLIGSPADYSFSMTAGHFTTSIVFLEATNTFVVSG